MKITVLTVGKKHDPLLKAAIEDYEKRLATYCNLSWQYIPTSDIKTESAAIIKAVESHELVFLLDERGTAFTSKDLARSLERAQNASTKSLAVIIGGAYVFRANATLSLSRLTLPHQLVRLVVVEQLYRAFSILSGSRYHHE